ncbi:hypothetical protein [Helicobacter sp. 11S02596-1]|uniref:hypothetical protein n=1 Tax=Helicobacter sp. 11S02596-1 TaxID=1476194 RepID=UPI000BA5B39A|nr:hypothetical protein [Helicobacter sp. 11S02596-1]PAF41513.1 hypothetical protein BJI48_08310 [Helicobacter sp. 11S02596-1]
MQQNKTWKDIWTQKSGNEAELAWLKEKLINDSVTEVGDYLMKLNGYDSKTGTLKSDSMREFITKTIAPKLAGCESFYDVGCGSGAFLYLLLEDLQNKNANKNTPKTYAVGGCDYSDSLIRVADLVFKTKAINRAGGGAGKTTP